MGALQDNYAVYWFSAASRLAAGALFYSMGPAWHRFAKMELITLAILLVAIAFG